MKRFVTVLLCLLIPSVSLAADNGYKVTYDGGSLQNVKAGNSLQLLIEQTDVKLVRGKETINTIPAAAITEISYGQDVHRRVGTAIGLAVISLGVGALMALSKSKKHYVGLTWADGDKKGGFAMQCDKNDYRGARQFSNRVTTALVLIRWMSFRPASSGVRFPLLSRYTFHRAPASCHAV